MDDNLQIIMGIPRRNKALLGVKSNHKWLPKGVNLWTTSPMISKSYSDKEMEITRAGKQKQMMEELENLAKELVIFLKIPNRPWE